MLFYTSISPKEALQSDLFERDDVCIIKGTDLTSESVQVNIQ